MWSAHAASITAAPRASLTNPGITYKVKFGYVNVTNTQAWNNFATTYANGTIAFDLRGQERAQGIYTFTVKSFGNGTLNLQFSTYQVPGIIAALAANINPTSTPVTVNYSANVASDPLSLTFLGTASQQISNGIVNGSGMFPLLMTVSGIFMVITMVDLFVSPLQGRKPFLKPKLAVSILIMSTAAFLIMLLITVQFVGVLKGLGI